MPASSAILATRSAIVRACVSDSITQGPAIKKREVGRPIPSDISEVSKGGVIGNTEDITGMLEPELNFCRTHEVHPALLVLRRHSRHAFRKRSGAKSFTAEILTVH
jgi:hypothetical protein